MTQHDMIAVCKAARNDRGALFSSVKTDLHDEEVRSDYPMALVLFMAGEFTPLNERRLFLLESSIDVILVAGPDAESEELTALRDDFVTAILDHDITWRPTRFERVRWAALGGYPLAERITFETTSTNRTY